MLVIRGSNPMAADSLTEIAPAETAVGHPTATARRAVNASVSDNTRRAYAGALGQLDAWLDGLRLDDAALAAYLAASSTTPAAPPVAPRWQSLRRGCGPASPARRTRPASRPRGFSPATAERPGHRVRPGRRRAGPLGRRDRRAALHGRAAAVGSRRAAVARPSGPPARAGLVPQPSAAVSFTYGTADEQRRWRYLQRRSRLQDV